jgi:hypothetical protein
MGILGGSVVPWALRFEVFRVRIGLRLIASLVLGRLRVQRCLRFAGRVAVAFALGSLRSLPFRLGPPSHFVLRRGSLESLRALSQRTAESARNSLRGCSATTAVNA